MSVNNFSAIRHIDDGDREVRGESGVESATLARSTTRRSAEFVVSGVLNLLRKSSQASHIKHDGVWLVVESLAYSFFFRRSGKNYECLSHKDRGRLKASLVTLASRLSQFTQEDRYQDLAKYWTSRLLALCMRDEVVFPKKAEYEAVPLFSGYLKTFVRLMVQRGDLDLAYSLQQCKRMWPALGEERAVAALAEHRVLMSSEPVHLTYEAKFALEQAVFSFVQFGGGKVRDWSKCSPSMNGHYGAPSTKGGALGYLQRLDQKSADVARESFRTSKSLKDAVLRGEVEKQRLYKLAEAGVPHYDKTLYPSGQANVTLIPEPAKFRIVTSGPPDLYTFLQPLQKEMLKAWSLHPCSTMKIGDLVAAARARFGSLSAFLCSGDYKAATDTLSKEATLYALNLLLEAWNVPGDLADAARRSFGSVRLNYPKGTVDDVDQTNGQLMGHPLSFVLLCIINLSTWIRATQLHRWDRKAFREGTEQALMPLAWRVFINGDDIVFPTDRRTYDRWVVAAQEVGFVLSLGKSYLSPVAGMINSVLFRYPEYRRVGYLNLKLCKGSSLKAGHSDAWDFQVGEAVSNMCLLSPWTVPFIPMALRVSKKFLVGANWFMPAARGGCGVSPIFATDKTVVTDWQRRLAAASICDPTLALGVAKPMPGLSRVMTLLRRFRNSPLVDFPIRRRVETMQVPFRPSSFKEATVEGGGWLLWESQTDANDLTAFEREARENEWDAWFARLVGLNSLFTDFREDEEVGTLEHRQFKALDRARKRWWKAASGLKPASLTKCFESRSHDLVFPFVPALPASWRLK